MSPIISHQNSTDFWFIDLTHSYLKATWARYDLSVPWFNSESQKLRHARQKGRVRKWMMEWNVHMGISQPVRAALQLFFHCSVKELQLFCRLGSTGLSHTTQKSWSSQLEAAWHTWIFPRTLIKLVFQSSIHSFANNIAMQYWNSAMFCSFQEQNGFRKTHGICNWAGSRSKPTFNKVLASLQLFRQGSKLSDYRSQIKWLVLRTKYCR